MKAAALSGIVLLAASGPAGAAPLTVNSLADTNDVDTADGVCRDAAEACSLRAAIEQANALPGLDDVVLPAGTMTLTLAGHDDVARVGDLDITDDLRIGRLGGEAAGQAVVDGGAIDRVFQVHPGVSATMVRFEVTNGAAAEGAGIRSDGALVLIGMAITKNVADQYYYSGAPNDRGGGIYSGQGATLSLRDTRVTGNRVTGGYGGGIYSDRGTVRLLRSEVTGNQAAPHGVSCFGLAVPKGGGIEIAGGTALIQRSTISGNSADIGGGMYLVTSSGERPVVTLDRSVVDRNTAEAHGGGIAGLVPDVTLRRTRIIENVAGWSGGGLYFDFEPGTGAGPAGTIVIDRSRIVDNEATGGGCTEDGPRFQGDGAGIFTETPLSLLETTVAGNIATGNGGGMRVVKESDEIFIDKSTFAGNVAAHGGAIACVGQLLRMQNSTLSANTASGRGGALWLPHNGTRCGDMTAVLLHVTIYDNAANNGGGVFVRGAGNTAEIKNSIVAGNAGDDCRGTPVSADYNIDSDGTCALNRPNDMPGTNPQLRPLALNGGQTRSHLPHLCTSPPVDEIPGATLSEDQREVTRPLPCGGEPRSDIGAVERERDE